jgi:hopanoid-associated sugar epimerase
MTKTFVTGGSGHVGANLVRALIARGDNVRALVRSASNNRGLEGLDVELVTGDLRDPESLRRAMKGCDRAYHLAAFVSLRSGDERAIYEVNVRGTKNVLDAALANRIERVVYCSSFGAVGVNPDGPSDETWTVDPAETHLDYELSKAMAEVEVHRAVNRGLDAVILNPSGVVGPHDYLPSSVGKTVLDLARGRLFAYIPGGFEFVAVRDVVDGHLRAMEKGRRGERYILSGGVHQLEDILTHLADVLGVRKPRLRLPPSVMAQVATVSSFVMKHFFPEVPPRFTPGTVKLLQSKKSADISKARRELGFTPTSIYEAFTDQVNWFRSEGQIQ